MSGVKVDIEYRVDTVRWLGRDDPQFTSTVVVKSDVEVLNFQWSVIAKAMWEKARDIADR